MYFVLLSMLRYDLKSINEYSLLNILYQWTADFFNLQGVVTEVTFLYKNTKIIRRRVFMFHIKLSAQIKKNKNKKIRTRQRCVIEMTPYPAFFDFLTPLSCEITKIEKAPNWA